MPSPPPNDAASIVGSIIPNPTPPKMPINPPIAPIRIASQRNINKIFRLLNPMAFSNPISLVLSKTAVIRVVTIPTPATIRDIAPIARIKLVKPLTNPLTVSTIT